MSKKTTKAKSSGRFGARYGVSVRKGIKNIEEIEKALHECPQCRQIKVKRESAGIWECRHCGYKFVGGAWAPQTPAQRSREQTLEEVGKEAA
jgi:large subunit ribosomal protein L37Ae